MYVTPTISIGSIWTLRLATKIENKTFRKCLFWYWFSHKRKTRKCYACSTQEASINQEYIDIDVDVEMNDIDIGIGIDIDKGIKTYRYTYHRQS